jgi:hypothetical protein
LRYLNALFLPFRSKWFLSFDWHLAVRCSFDPRLGLGSSSALLAGVHFLCESFSKVDLPVSEIQKSTFDHKSTDEHESTQEKYARILLSLRHVGNQGSGYDALVQGAALNVPSTQVFEVWCDPQNQTARLTNRSDCLFRWKHQASLLNMELSIVDSETYSDTAQHISQKASESWIYKQQSLAKSWLHQSLKLEVLPELMSQSRKMAEEQGLVTRGGPLFEEKFLELETSLGNVKTMGAGCGDGLLVFGQQAQMQDDTFLKKHSKVLTMTSEFSLPERLIGLQKKLLEAKLNGQLQLYAGDVGQASAPSNIALTKYWGKRGDALQIPLNSSLSYTLGGFRSFTKVQPLGSSWPVEIWQEFSNSGIEKTLKETKHQMIWSGEKSNLTKNSQSFWLIFGTHFFPKCRS